MSDNDSQLQISEIAERIREMRHICGYSSEEMAKLTEFSLEDYKKFESGEHDIPFTFIHKCARVFDLDLSDLVEGQSARLTSYTLTRRKKGLMTVKENGISIESLAAKFKNKIASPYFCIYEYQPDLQDKPIQLVQHPGQEFNIVISGKLKVQVGDNFEILGPGDSIYFNSTTPHGELAVGDRKCKFVSVVIHSDLTDEIMKEQAAVREKQSKQLEVQNFIDQEETDEGNLLKLGFLDEDKFNFAFDVVDEIANNKPEKLAMIHLNREKNETRYTFRDMKALSSQAANYFTALGIKKGDKVMLVLKRRREFWPAILGLHKIGAVAVPATHQLKVHDFEYRFTNGEIKAIVCTCDDNTPDSVDKAAKNAPNLKHKLIVGEDREGWLRFDTGYKLFSNTYERREDSACGKDPMLMFFTSGTSGYPKMALHSYKYALGHFHTAKYWHCVQKNGLHLTISDTGWAKSLWGKLYGQWMYEGAIFTYDFDRFKADDILPLFAKYQIKTLCCPPTIYRMLIKEDLSKYDLSSIEHATVAGEALNPEIFNQFKKATGLELMEGFGQTETTLTIANLVGMKPKPGSMGKPVPLYDIHLLDEEGNEVGIGENGEICIKTDEKLPCGLFIGYYNDDELTKESWHDGYYHTGDIAWKDEDGYYWYVNRIDDVIKSSGYRIGPFEIENVIMELPYVLECGVSAVPDELRGQIVKATIKLVDGTEGTEELKKEIQNYVKKKTAPYKYPRIVEFVDELPKTISGKIIRKKL